MSLRDEIEGLPECCGQVKLSDVLRVVDKHAAPVVDMTPGMQPGAWHVACMLDGMGGERERVQKKGVGCKAGTDGDCYWNECPQTTDGEPHKSGRSCPLWNSADDS